MPSKTTTHPQHDETHGELATNIPEVRPAPEPPVDLSTPPPTPEHITIRTDQLQAIMDRMEKLERSQQPVATPTPYAFNVNPAALNATATNGTTFVPFSIPNSTPESAAAVLSAPDASGFRPNDLVTVLHGWGRVDPERVEGKSGLSKKVYRARGGVVRDVLYSDAKHWQEQWGSKFLKILPRDATEADFARVTGIANQIDAPKLVALLESADLDALILRWGVDRALAWIQRFALIVQQAGAAQAPQARPAQR